MNRTKMARRPAVHIATWRTGVVAFVIAAAFQVAMPASSAAPAAAEHRDQHNQPDRAAEHRRNQDQLAPTAESWAPADEATIHPGVQTVSPTGQCTANFIFTNGTDVLIGQAAHCTGNSAATSTNGCEQDPAPHPIGTEVEIEGATQPGTLVYSSWNTMLASGESDDATCSFNDFALVKIDPADVARVNPSLPTWGGPNGTGTSAVGEQVHAYGNSSLRGGIDELKPKVGVTVGVDPSGWSYDVYTATPGIPGDSGSPVLNAAGEGLGVLVTVQLAPLAGSNGITDLGMATDYARSHDMPQLALADGTEAFDGSPLNLLPVM